MLSLSIETYVGWVTRLLFLGSGLAALAGLLTLGGARRMRYFQVRRQAVMRGWGRLGTSVILLVVALLVMAFGNPMMRLALPDAPTGVPGPTPRPALIAPTTTASATLAASATNSDTPGPSPTASATGTPTISPTPALPQSFITPILTATVTPPVQASAVNIRFSLHNDCTVPVSTQFFDQLPKQIYAHFFYDSWLPGVQWSGVWLRNGVVVYTETHLWDGSTGGCGYSNDDNGKNWWTAGAYEVQIFVGDRWLASSRFDVVRASPSPTVSPTPLPRPRTPTDTPLVTPSATNTPTSAGSPTASATATGTPSPTGTPTRSPTPTASVTGPPTATIYPPGVTALAVIQMPPGLTTGVLRATPPDGQVVVFVTSGTPVEVLTGYQLIGGVIWRQVRLASGVEGWIQLFLLRITPPP